MPPPPPSLVSFTRKQVALRRRYALRVAREARRIQAAAARIVRWEARLRKRAARLQKRVARAAVEPSTTTTADEDEGHSATQFGWRSANEGFIGIADYAEAVAESAESA